LETAVAKPPHEGSTPVKAIEATLLQDHGTVDRQLIRRNLLADPGITGVFYGPGDHSLRIEYDPVIVAGAKLLEILCCHGVSDEVVPPPDPEGAGRWIEILKDGRRVLIRPIRPSDVARNATFVEKLSPPSKHYLFLGGIAQLSDVALRRLCDPDYAHDMAYIALALDARTGEPGDQVGVCRFAGGDPLRGAEISVAVADDWQRQGLGKTLLRHLIDYARARGVARLYSMDPIDNVRMRKLARDVGFSEYPDPDDIHQLIYSLDLRR
jgi:GNAT superfamily N-acetyltransferase